MKHFMSPEANYLRMSLNASIVMHVLYATVMWVNFSNALTNLALAALSFKAMLQLQKKLIICYCFALVLASCIALTHLPYGSNFYSGYRRLIYFCQMVYDAIAAYAIFKRLGAHVVT